MEDFLDFIMEAMDAEEEDFCRRFPDPFLLVEFEGIQPVGELDTSVGYRRGFADTLTGLPVGLERIKDDKLCIVRKAGEAAEDPSVHVGRAPDNDIVLDYPRVSKRHALLVRTDEGGYAIQDAGSTNGTSLNDRRLDPGEKAPLANGDKLEFGGDFYATFYTPEGLFSYINRLAEEEQVRKKRNEDA